MWCSDNWQDYELLDASDGERLERWKDIILIRPDPQIIWSGKRKNPLWNQAHAIYHRSQSGGGYWEKLKNVPDVWSVNYEDMTFRLKPMGFKHTGLFPEQAVNWTLAKELIKKADREISVLNLFSYTGAATIACLKAGASVTHVDASKGMVAWAKENAVASGVEGNPVRWIVDDCIKFVQREIRRGNKYDVIIMDPPSYGRGPGGEVWKLENEVYGFIEMCKQVLSDDPLAVLVNSYTAGLSPAVMSYILNSTVVKDFHGLTVLASPCGEMVYYEQDGAKYNKVPYGSNTLGTHGCGPTCMAMVVSTFSNVIVEPDEMGRWAVEKGYYVKNVGTAYGLMTAAAKKYGFAGNYVVGANIAGFEKVAQAMIAQGVAY